MIMLSAFIALEGQSLLNNLIGKVYNAGILQIVRPPCKEDAPIQIRATDL